MAMTDARLAELRDLAECGQAHGSSMSISTGVLIELLDELERLREDKRLMTIGVEALQQSLLNRLSRLEERMAVIEDEKDTKPPDAAPEPLKGRDFPLNREFRDTKTGTLLKVAVEYDKKFNCCKGCFYHKIDCVGYDRPLCGATPRSDGQGVIFVSVEADAAPSEAVEEATCQCGNRTVPYVIRGVELGPLCEACFRLVWQACRVVPAEGFTEFFIDGRRGNA